MTKDLIETIIVVADRFSDTPSHILASVIKDGIDYFRQPEGQEEYIPNVPEMEEFVEENLEYYLTEIQKRIDPQHWKSEG